MGDSQQVKIQDGLADGRPARAVISSFHDRLSSIADPLLS